MMCGLELRRITKRFGDIEVLRDLNLTVNDGELLVLLGPSGSGKTTVLRIIAGLERPTSGSIYIDGRDVTPLSPRDRDVAMVFQNYALYPHMTVFENIALPLRARGIEKDKIDRKVTETAELLRIKHILDKKPSEISGGEQQRVAVGRAIVRNPKVFLFDEPLSNLDAKLRVTTRGFLKRLQKELQVTTVYVTHDQSEAMTMADRVAVIDAGRIMQVGSPTELYNRPANTFVAGFIGSPPMNFIKGEIVSDSKVYFVSGKIRVLIDAYRAKEKFVTLGVRPEDVIISEVKREGYFEGRVYVTEPMGNVQYITIDVDGLRILAQAEPSFPAEINRSVYFYFRDSGIHIFSNETTDRIELNQGYQ